MHLPCENTNNPCPVIFPITSPLPRCDCQEDHSTLRHCRLCHLPFDIENRLQPNGAAFCSCFLGDSRVLFRYPIPTVFWVPMFYLVPICASPGVDSGRSSLSSLSAGSNHSLPLNLDTFLDECSNLSQKRCVGERAESDSCLPRNDIVDSSVDIECSLPKDCLADSSKSSISFKNSGLNSLVVTNSSLLPEENVLEKISNQTFLSDEVTHITDSNSQEETQSNSAKGIDMELKRIEISPSDSLSMKKTLDITPSHSEDNRPCLNEKIDVRAPTFSEIKNFETFHERFYSAYNDKPKLDDRRLAQMSKEKSNELTKRASVTAPSNSEARGIFSTLEKHNQNCPSRVPSVEAPSTKTLFGLKNDTYSNSAEPSTSYLNRHKMKISVESSPQSFVPSNVSGAKISSASICKNAESRYPFNTLNGTNAILTNSLPMNPTTKPCHQDFTSMLPLKPIEVKSNDANFYNYELRNPSNSQVTQLQNPFQYPILETRMERARRFEAACQTLTVDVSSGNEMEDTFQVCSDEPNRTTSSSLYLDYWSADNSFAHPRTDPRANLAPSNTGGIRHRSANDFRNEFSTENQSGFMEGSDLIQEILSMNEIRKNSLEPLF